ncbi:MAG: DUF1097 domain-containing protein [Ktedonobacteraceae bacterium]
MSHLNDTSEMPLVAAACTVRIVVPSPDRTTVLPLELRVGVLAALTIVVSWPPLNLPVFAIYVAWAGALLCGKGTKESVTRLWPAFALGTSWGALCSLLVSGSTSLLHTSVNQTLLITMAVVAVAAITLLLLRHLPLFATTPAAFLGFASFDATQAGAFGPYPHSLFSMWLSATLMLLCGPILVWATGWLAIPQRARGVSTGIHSWTPTTLPASVAPKRPRSPRALHGQHPQQRRPLLRPVRLLALETPASSD